MDPTTFSIDQVDYQLGPVQVPATLVNTWIVMAVLVVGSWVVTRRLSSGKHMGRWQDLLEVIVGYMRREIRELSHQDPRPFLPFVGTLFIFIAMSNVLEIIPGFVSPAGGIATTGALAVCVFFAVPIYGVLNQGLVGYLKNYVRPSPFMLPFNIIGELSRTLALAVRLFGNVMSGTKVVAILLGLVPLLAPAVMQLLGLLIGFIQAYVFAMLAMVYISSGLRAREDTEEKAEEAEAPAASDEMGSAARDADEASRNALEAATAAGGPAADSSPEPAADMAGDAVPRKDSPQPNPKGPSDD